MHRSPKTLTKTDRAIEERMVAVAGDNERVEVLGKARAFKRSWIELAEVLTRTAERESWRRWGFDSFEAYCKRELHITAATATKLLGSFRFLRDSEPRVIERTREDPEAPIPSLRAVDFVARAEERGAADDTAMEAIRRAAFEEGAGVPLLSRRFKEVAFPMAEGEREDRLRAQIAAAARRLANLAAEPEAPLSRALAIAVEELVGEILDSLEHARGGDGDPAGTRN